MSKKMHNKSAFMQFLAALAFLILGGAAFADIKTTNFGAPCNTSGQCSAYKGNIYSSGVYDTSLQAACNRSAAASMAQKNIAEAQYTATFGTPTGRVINSVGALGVVHGSGTTDCKIDWTYQNATEYGGGTGFWENAAGDNIAGYTFTCSDPNSKLNVAATSGTVQGYCTCNEGYADNPAGDKCAIVVKIDDSKKPLPQEVCTSNPIYPLTGVKKEFVDTGIRIGGVGLTLTYDSTGKIQPSQGSGLESIGPNELGALWKSSLHRKLQISVGSKRALLSRGDGKILNFSGNGAGIYTADVGNANKLISITGGYLFTDISSGDQETYDSTGKLTGISTARGMQLSFTYSGGNLTQVQSSDGRRVVFTYVNNLISQITDPNGGILTVTYDAQPNLVTLVRQDGKTQQFLYENASLPWALTGKVDENNSRYATFTYDIQGRAIAGEHAGGVERVSIVYEQPPALTVVDNYDAVNNILYRRQSWESPTGTTLRLSNGQSNSIGAVNLFGMSAVASQSQSAGSGCAASVNAVAYDANGNIASQDDFQGQRICYAYDSSNREIKRVEGLANSVACASVTPDGASLPAGARKITTTWHPDWRLPVLVNEPARQTTTIYQGQPDPFSGNAIANCTPSANLPNGKPLPLACKKVVQANKENVTVGYGQDADANNVSLYLQADGSHGSVTFTDSSVRPKTVTAAGPAYISTSQSAVGGSSAYFDGTTAYLSIPQNAEFEMGSGDYTVEAWVNPSENRDAAIVFKGRSRYSNFAYWDSGFGIRTSSGGEISFYFNTNFMNPPAVVLTYAPGVPLNQWSHVAMVVKNGTGYAFINGVLVGAKGSVGEIPTSTEGVYIGLMPTNVNTSVFKGYIDDVRITKGVARYISSFTPPALTNVDTAVPAVTSSYAYDAAGRLLSSVDPNGKTTTYVYYTGTSFTGVDPNAIGHTTGDLQSVTNPAGHVTQYTQYDRAGRVRQMIDPKGVVTDISYTPRGWVSTVTTTAPGAAGRTTTYTYDYVGQLTGVALPDGSTLSYTYDAAHRLVGVTDAKGNSVSYTLDNMGNRIAEEIKDPTGTLQRSISRSFDALNRVQQVTGAAR